MIILLILTIIFIITGFQPLTTAGVFFAICFLPGLVLFSTVKKQRVQFEDLILAFPVSTGISALITLAFLYMGVDVRFIIHIVFGAVGFLILSYGIKYRKLPSLTVKLSGREMRFIILALLVTLMFSIPLLSERVAISAHGFHHSTIATQILNGIFPPENPGLGGTALSYHWGYHAFVAALSSPTGLPPLLVMSLLNVLSLYFIFCIAYRSAGYLDFPEWYRYLVPLALIGLMRADAVIFFINKLSAGIFMDVRHISFPEVRPSEILQSWIWGGGAPWFDRRLFFINKFYNANTMPIGIALCLSYFMVLLIQIKKRYEDNNTRIFQITLGLILIGCCILYPPLAIILLLHGPFWAVLLFLIKRPDLIAGIRDALEILIPYTLAVIIVLPYLLSVSGNTNEPVIRINFYDQSIINLITFWLPMPFIVAGIILSYKKLPSEIYYFLIASASVCLGLSIFTQVTFGNSAKFTFILSFFYALFFVYAVSELMILITWQRLRRGIISVIVLWLFITPVITEAAYIISPWFSDKTHSFSGRHILFSHDKKRNEAYEWIRNNTPPDALLLLTYVETSNPDAIAQNSTYEPAALTERNLFIIKDWYTVSIQEYMKRIMIREKLFSDNFGAEAINYLRELNRPLYLLVEDTLSPLIINEAVFDNYDFNSDIFHQVFTNSRQRVYQITLR